MSYNIIRMYYNIVNIYTNSDLVDIVVHQNITWIVYNIYLVEPEGVYL